MHQMTFGDAEYAGKKKRTRRQAFLAEMDQVVPWGSLIRLIEPFYPVAGRGRRPYPLETMLRIHLMQNWFGLSDPMMEESLYEVASMRQFAQLTLLASLPDETTILTFRHLIEAHDLAAEILSRVNAHLSRKGLLLKRGTMVDATIISAPSSTKNASGERDPEMHQTRKGNQWFFGLKAHIGADTESGLVHTVTTTPANVADVTVVDELLHGQETVVYGDSGYLGAADHAARPKVDWQIARRPSSVASIKDGRVRARVRREEYRKAQVRSRVEHVFRVVKRQFGYTKVRFRGLAKNTTQIITLFALSNLYLARKRLLATGSMRPQFAG
jgi:IS5 family transposase